MKHDAQAVLSPWNPKVFHSANNCWLQQILWHMADRKSQLPILNGNENQDKTLNEFLRSSLPILGMPVMASKLVLSKL